MNFEANFKIEKQDNKERNWLEKVREYYQGDFYTHSLRSNREEIGGGKERMVHSDTRLMQYAEKK